MFHQVYQEFYPLQAWRIEPSPSFSFLGTILRVWPFLTERTSSFTSRHRARRRTLTSALIGLSTTPQRARSTGIFGLIFKQHMYNQKSIQSFFSRVPQSRINHVDELDLDKVGWIKSSGSNRTSFVAPPEIVLSER